MRRVLFLMFCLSTALCELRADVRFLEVQAVKQTTEKNIRGVVLSQDGETLPGASILVKGTKGGAITDLDGVFRLSVKEGQTLIVSFVGMQTREVLVTKKNDYQIQLGSDAKALDEVMVTGYQTLSKERSTGAFAKVSSATLEMKRMESLSSVLEGQVAGYVNGKIRGVTTMNAIANPMVVIDGFPVENTSINRIGQATENMPDLNPEDIESITVLKDAAAASIYGARAANGVIVITTKKAKQGKTDVNFSSTFTMQPYSYHTKNRTNAADVIDMQRQWASGYTDLVAGGESAMNIANDLRQNGGYPSQGVDLLLDMYTNKISMEEGNKRLDKLAGMGHNYYDQAEKYAKRNPFYQQYNLRVGKTTDRNSFNFSTSYWKNQYSDLNSDDWKLGINLTNTLAVTQWMQFDLGIYLKYGEENSQTYSVYSPGFSVMPYDALVAADGRYIAAASTNDKDRDDIISANGLYSELITPMDELNYGLRKNTLLDTRAFAKLKIDFTSWLNYHVQFQYETGSNKGELFREVASNFVRSQINNFTSSVNGKLVYNLPNGNMMSMQERSTNAYNFRHQLNLNKTIDEKHNLAWILGQELRHTLIRYSDNVLYGYDPKLLSFSPYDENALASFNGGLLGRQSLRPDNSKGIKELMNRFVSFYSNASYTYDDKYVLSGSIRWDRSNLWGTNSKFQNKPLWSVGGSWNVDKESFFQSDVVNMLKLRASYGIGGNIARGTAPYMVARYFAGSTVPGTSGMVIAPPNPNIRWEKTGTFNVGVDFSLLQNRLLGSVEYYNKSSVDLLASTSLSPTQGFGSSSMLTNIGEMVNRGFELTLQGDIIRKKDFTWHATLLYALNKNKVKYVDNETDNVDLKINFSSSYPTIGEPLTGLYAFKWAGLNENGDPQIYNQDGNVVATSVTSANALKYCGTSVPVHGGTFTNALRYKNFEFSAMLIFATGHKLRSSQVPNISMTRGRIVSTNKDIVNRWSQAGDEGHTDVPRLLFSNDQQNYNSYRSTLYAYSDLFIRDASNIRLKNVALSYRVPTAWCKKVYLTGAKLQFNVENAAVLAFDSKARYDLGVYNSPNYVWGVYLNF